HYNYLLAAIYVKVASNIDRGSGASSSNTIQVLNQEIMLKAVEELRAAQAKKVYHTYFREMTKERFDRLPPSRRYEDRVLKLSYLLDASAPNPQLLINLFRSLPPYADYLVRSGQRAEAEDVLSCWRHYIELSHANAFSLLEMLSTSAIINVGGEAFAPAWERIDQTNLASNVRSLAGQLAQPFDRWKAERDTEAYQTYINDLGERGSLLARIMVPVGGRIQPREAFRPGRLLDFLLLEYAGFLVLMKALFLLMLGAVLITVRRRNPGKEVSPLPAPGLSLRSWSLIIGLGVVLPVSGYLLYAHGLEDFNMRTFSATLVWPRAGAELLLVGLLVVALTT
ncbi:MAG: hypothetical protein AAF492_33175, partial [Verrucomicrobiota bacterium]